ncbi:MAG: PQQ-dependent sugar dehydrogenase [Bacteroidetes bacterium]|nr:PQQ-dependent sugar dehydrogenase [Bacteroidota bacterium]
MKQTYIFLAGILLISSLLQAQPKIQFQIYASGLSVPVDIKSAGDDRLFVVEQSGKIKIIKNGVVNAQPFINLATKIGYTPGSEQGLLGMAFPPDYAYTGKFYVNLTNQSGDTRVVRYKVSATNPDSAVLSSEQVIMSINQDYANHNGGNLAFGPDGYLYIGTGDGGSFGDPLNRSQNMLSFLGKMLRIDVSGNTAGYAIPADNPYVPLSSILNEIWSSGMRNPWKYSFDKLTGDLWVGDVGQNAWEEIDMEPANSPGGYNYGWRCYEGNHNYNTNGCQGMSNYDGPIYEYQQAGNGCSVTGGFVYRGTKFGKMFGKYFFGDYCFGKMWYLEKVNNAWVRTDIGVIPAVTTFGEDKHGELYAANYNNGSVYHLVDTSQCQPTAFITNDSVINSCTNSYTLVALSGQGLSYQWYYNGAPVVNTVHTLAATQSGSYYAEVTDSVTGCSALSASVYLNLGTATQATIIGLDTLYCNTSAVVSMQAIPAGGVFSGSGVNGTNFHPNLAKPGYNTVTYMYYDTLNNCTNTTTASVFVSGCTGMATASQQAPFATITTVENGLYQLQFINEVKEHVTLHVYDVSGKQILQKHLLAESKVLVDIKNQPNGMYILKVTDNEQQAQFKLMR